MKNLIEKVNKKLDDYGIQIFDQYESKSDAYVIIAEHMAIIIHPNSIIVSFEATTKPETSANYILIINEIKTKDIFISDSFIFTTDNKIVCGEKAYEIVKNTLKQNTLNEENQEKYYKAILENTEGFEC